MTPFRTPLGYAGIKVVGSFQELVATPFAGDCNAICWPRTLRGDFDEVVQCLVAGAGITTLDDALLTALPVSTAGSVAIDTLLADQHLLRSIGSTPALDCVRGYLCDDDRTVPTDVYSFHVDSATVATDTWLCSYTAPASEGLRNDEAQRRVDIPETRARLLERFGGDDGDGFRAYLRENHHDLHYAPVASARPFSFGVGNLWRIAVAYPGCPVPACIHRAPEDLPGRPPRLLLIS